MAEDTVRTGQTAQEGLKGEKDGAKLEWRKDPPPLVHPSGGDKEGEEYRRKDRGRERERIRGVRGWEWRMLWTHVRKGVSTGRNGREGKEYTRGAPQIAQRRIWRHELPVEG